MSVGIQPLSYELFLDAGIPEILHLVVGSPGQMLRDLSPPVAQNPVNVDDRPLLLLRERPPLQIRPQIVDPSQSAALPAPMQSCTYAHTILSRPELRVNNGNSPTRHSPIAIENLTVGLKKHAC